MIGKLNTDTNLVDLFGRPTSLAKIDECFRIVHETIDALDRPALDQLLGAYQKDIDKVMEDLVQETYRVLYGGDINKEIVETNPAYLDKLVNTFEETMRIENMNYFVSSVFPDVEMSWHHVEWGNLIDRYQRIAVLAARDHGKSFWFSMLYPIWKMYRYTKGSSRKSLRAREGFIFSHTKDKAQHNLEAISEAIQDNDILREKLYRRDGFIKTEIRARNGAIVRVKGLFGRTRGYHPQWIVADDILNDNMLYSQTQREKAIEYFYSVLENMLVPDGQFLSVGTPFHKMDLYGSFKDKDRQKVWVYREYPAVFPDGTVLWSNRYSFRQLMQKRDINGNLRFSREFLCRPVSTDSSIFPWSILDNATKGMNAYTLVNNIEAFPVKFDKVVMGCDFAISANVGADYTVFTVWGIDAEENMWLLHCYRKLGATFDEQLNQIKVLNTHFRPNIIVLEKNNFQQIYNQSLMGTDLPVKPHHTGGEKNSFEHGLPSLAVMFERGKIKMPYGNKESVDMADLIKNEFNNVTFTDKGLQAVGSHDDCAMSSWLAKLAAQFAKFGSFGFDFL